MVTIILLPERAESDAAPPLRRGGQREGPEGEAHLRAAPRAHHGEDAAAATAAAATAAAAAAARQEDRPRSTEVKQKKLKGSLIRDDGHVRRLSQAVCSGCPLRGAVLPASPGDPGRAGQDAGAHQLGGAQEQAALLRRSGMSSLLFFIT